MRFEVFIPSSSPNGLDISMVVEAKNWLRALKNALTQCGEDGEEPQHTLCQIRPDDSVHVTDAVSHRVFRVKPMLTALGPSSERSLHDSGTTMLLQTVAPQDLVGRSFAPEGAGGSAIIPHTSTAPDTGEGLDAKEAPAPTAQDAPPADAKRSPTAETEGHPADAEVSACPDQDDLIHPERETVELDADLLLKELTREESAAPSSQVTEALGHASDESAARAQIAATEGSRDSGDDPDLHDVPAESNEVCAPSADPVLSAESSAAELPPEMAASILDDHIEETSAVDAEPTRDDPKQLEAAAAGEADAPESIESEVPQPVEIDAAREVPAAQPPVDEGDEDDCIDLDEDDQPSKGKEKVHLMRVVDAEVLKERGKHPYKETEAAASDSRARITAKAKKRALRITNEFRLNNSRAENIGHRRLVAESTERLSEVIEDHRRNSSATLKVISADDINEIGGSALEDIFLEIPELFENNLTLDQGTEFVMELAMEHIEAESGSVIYATPDGSALHFAATRGPKAEQVKNHSLPITEGIAGFCTRHGISLMVDDVAEEPRHHAEIAMLVGLEVTSMVCAPVQFNGRVYGCLQLLNHSPGTTFSTAQLDALGYLGFQLAKFIQELLMSLD